MKAGAGVVEKLKETDQMKWTAIFMLRIKDNSLMDDTGLMVFQFLGNG